MTCTDKLGRALAVGDFIVYGHALGRCAALRIGRILDIRSVEVKQLWNQEPKQEWRIRVAHLDDDWDGNPKSCGTRAGTLQYPKRTLRLRPEDLTWEQRDMLESFIP